MGGPQANVAYVALGSNLGLPRENLLRAMERLQQLSDAPMVRSSIYETDPVDCPPDSPRFANAAVALVPRPDETPESLLGKLQAIEREFGRQPTQAHNAPRPLDLDLIAFGGETCKTAQLVVPHPRAHLRRFVLEPLAGIAPNLVLPGQTATVTALLKTLP